MFNYTDHLGNIRLSYVLDPSGEGLKVMEEIDEGDSMNTKTKYFPVNQSHYYPFDFMNKLCLIIVFIFLSCNNSQDKKQKIIKPKTFSNKIVESITIDTNSLFNIADKKSFNVEKYKLDLDSILNGINKDFKMSIKLDTIKDRNFLNVNFEETCFEKINTETNLITKHTFSINVGGKRLNHSIIIFEFDSIKKLQTNYDCMKSEALNTPDPGLSYANDYVTFSYNKIYWINSSCMFSYLNHNKFVDVFKKNMKFNETNSIQCECGKVICTISDK